MRLGEFIEKYMCKNTIIRLWVKYDNGHKLLIENDKDVCMEWQLLKNEVWQSKYKNNKVIGVTDIVNETYRESVNIVIEGD